MILADTSIWIDFFRNGNEQFAEYILKHHILMHPIVLGELLCGNLKDREQTINDLFNIRHVPTLRDYEVYDLIEQQNLYSKGVGFNDIHLLGAARLSGLRLWTLDKRLRQMAKDFRVSFN